MRARLAKTRSVQREQIRTCLNLLWEGMMRGLSKSTTELIRYARRLMEADNPIQAKHEHAALAVEEGRPLSL